VIVSQPKTTANISPINMNRLDQPKLELYMTQNSPIKTAITMLKKRVNEMADSASADLLLADNFCQRIAVEIMEAGEKYP